MPTLQEKFIQADAIVKETKFMLKLQVKWWTTRKEDDLSSLNVQTKKVSDLIEAYYPNQNLRG